MDFNDTPQEAEFRATVRRWLSDNAPQFEGTTGRASGPDDKAILARAKAWQAAKAKAGYGAVTWPQEYGGMGGSPIQAVIFGQEEARYKVPTGFFSIGLGMCMPTVMAHGTPEQKDRYIKKALFAEEIWCQLFSEPAAGSDVAGLRTRAERDGEGWVVNGQKVWTTGAHYSDYGILVARTDPNVPKHKGITFFLVDMHAKGVEVRPIKQVSGGASFNEVFFTDVRIPDAMRVGAVGNGWNVAITTLMNERFTIAGGSSGVNDIDALVELARGLEFEDGPAIKNAVVRDKIADWYVQSQGLKYTHYRTLTALSRGQTPGPENSIGKIVSGKRGQDLAAFSMELQEMAGALTTGSGAGGSPMTAAQAYLFMPSMRIAGGTDEILRNIVAERVLGLPADVRVDKDVPFKDMPRGR